MTIADEFGPEPIRLADEILSLEATARDAEAEITDLALRKIVSLPKALNKLPSREISNQALVLLKDKIEDMLDTFHLACEVIGRQQAAK